MFMYYVLSAVVFCVLLCFFRVLKMFLVGLATDCAVVFYE